MTVKPKKLSDENVREIRSAAKLRRTLTNKSLARRYGVSLSHIENIIAGDKRASA